MYDNFTTPEIEWSVSITDTFGGAEVAAQKDFK